MQENYKISSKSCCFCSKYIIKAKSVLTVQNFFRFATKRTQTSMETLEET